MKVNLQKIIALIIAVTFIITALNISVYATSEPSAMTPQEYKSSQSYLIDKYCNGDITFSEWQEQQTAVNAEFLESNKSVGDTAYALAVTTSNQFSGVSQKISNAVENWGDGARERVYEWWNEVCNTNNVPTENTQTSTTNMHGRGARIDAFEKNKNNKHYSVLLCDYIVIDTKNSLFINRTNDGSSSPFAYVGNDGKYSFNGNASASSWSNLTDPNWSYKFYGDVRYTDGTPAPSDDEFVITGTIKKFGEMSEKDLEDLLNDFSEEMDLQNPDLSTIEGLLNAIYARMGTLDSDNDNQLLSEVLAAIKAIKTSDKDNTELLELLEDIKNSLVFDNGENKETFSEQLKKIVDNQITRDDFVIDEDLYNNHGEILKERLLGKFSFIYNMKTFVTYCFDEYSNTSETPEFNIEYDGKSYSINLNAFNEYLPTIQWILAAFIYLTYAYHTYRKIPSYINGGDNE